MDTVSKKDTNEKRCEYNKEDGNMVAHAWLRCGQLYMTGGDGMGYAMVAKFRAF